MAMVIQKKKTYCQMAKVSDYQWISAKKIIEAIKNKI